jgi:hypothetical protein
MISTCAGIDKYAFYLDFKGVLSSKPQVSVIKSMPERINFAEINHNIIFSLYFSAFGIFGVFSAFLCSDEIYRSL